jgi:outer membrane receptor protein involved in Fe transport
MQTGLPQTQRIVLAAVAFASIALSTGVAQDAPAASTPATTAPSGSTPPSPAAVSTSSSASTDQAIVLSPFEVTSTEDTGYQARETLAGSRIKTNLADIASPISVVTRDFMDDIGATDVNQILTYTVGTEGTLDFSANNPQLGRTTDNVAQDPNSATRGRGLAAFDITRDYFFSLTLGNPVFATQGIGESVGFDTYNLDNVTIVRGSDSILAGLGSPAGIINYAPQTAGLTRDTADIQYKFGSYGTQRAVINGNYVVKPDVLAIRVAAVWNDYQFEQKPSFDHDKRYYVAATWQPFPKTTVHASFESVNVDERLPNTFTPEDDITQWIALGKPTSPAPGVTAPNLNADVNGNDMLYITPQQSIYTAYNDSTLYQFYQLNLSNAPLWQPYRFSNNQYGNWHDININFGQQNMKLSTAEVSVDQEVFPGFDVNVAWFHENGDNHQVNNSRPDYVVDEVDVNQELPSGAANPYFGDTFMFNNGLDVYNQTISSNTVYRGSATYNLDLTKYNKWFGRYVATGFAENRNTPGDFLDYNIDNQGTAVNTGGGPGIVTYTGGSAGNGYVMTSSGAQPLLVTNAPFLNTNGTTTNNYTTFKTLKEEYKSLTELETSAFVAQAYLLDNLVVGTFGLRRDIDRQGFLTTSGVDSATGVVDPLPYGQFGQAARSAAQTKTYQLVLHGPKIGPVDLSWLSVGYDQSQNFVPDAGSVDLLNNPVANPTGMTKDYSIMTSLLGGKLSAKIDWYTTQANGAPDASVNFPLVQWTIPYEILGSSGTNANPQGGIADLAAQAGVKNFQTFLGNVTTGEPGLANAYSADTVAKGMELELTYNVMHNWRVYATLTRESAVQTNIATPLTTLINKEVAYWQQIGIWTGPYRTTKDWGGTSQPEDAEMIYNNDILGAEVAYESASGAPSQQLHHWKASMVTNYTVDQGPLKNLGVGLGLRWLDKTIIGDPAILGNVGGAMLVTGLDLQHPYTTPAETSVETWLSYSMKVADKYHLMFRLEVDNLGNKAGYQPVYADGAGTHEVFAIVPPPTFNFTTELKF